MDRLRHFYRGTGATVCDLDGRPDGTVACVADALSHPKWLWSSLPTAATLLACENLHPPRDLLSLWRATGRSRTNETSRQRSHGPTDYALTLAGACGRSLFAGEFLRAERGGGITHRVAAPSGHGLWLPCSADQIGEHSSWLTADTDPQRACSWHSGLIAARLDHGIGAGHECCHPAAA